MAEYSNGYWQSLDGLKLHYRDYAGGAEGRPPILCIPGLTRNPRDFEPVADRLAGEWRLICVSLRGRGKSEAAKDSATYNPLQYAEDIAQLIEQAGLERFILFGTSLGALITMALAPSLKGKLAGVMMNDAGPVVEEAGLERIRGYVGTNSSQPTWVHMARQLAEGQAAIYPDYKLQDWIDMAKRLCRLNSSGRIVFDYDARIAEPFKAAPTGVAPPDMWPLYEALDGVPVLVVRGARSDILSSATAKAMVKRIGTAELVTVPRTGHAPVLDESEAEAGIDRLLERVLA